MGKAIPVDLGVVSFKSRSKARVHFQGILQSYSVGDRVSEEHGRQLVELLKLHPEAASKIGSGVSHFEVLGADFDTQCFHVFRTDGTYEDFSLHACVDQK